MAARESEIEMTLKILDEVAFLFVEQFDNLYGKTVSSYTSGQLVKKATANAEGSILGKLYRLNISGSDSVKLFIVSNVPLSANKKKIGEEVVCLGNLPQNTTIEIDDALKKELNVPDVDLSKVYYLCTDINLRNPENEVQGKLVMSFEQLKGCEPSNPHALYGLAYQSRHLHVITLVTQYHEAADFLHGSAILL